MADKKTITVKSNLKKRPDGSYPLAIFDRDARHPAPKNADGKDIGSGGEAWVAGEKEVEVFPTPAIIQALRNERIVEVGGSSKAISEAVDAEGQDDTAAKRDAPNDDEKLNDEAKKKASEKK